MRIYIFLLSCLSIFSVGYAQYSSYYNVNTNINANINQNIRGTITSIDYGALAIANAQRQKNEFEIQKFTDERQKEIAFSIAADPLKAVEYGMLIIIDTKNKKQVNKETLTTLQNASGLKHFKLEYVAPNSLLFTMLNPFQVQNSSKEGVKTDIIFFVPKYNTIEEKIDLEEEFSTEYPIVGKEFLDSVEDGKVRKIFYHKRSLSRATVFGQKGYKYTLVWEDKYENCITDNYAYYFPSVGKGCSVDVKVRTYGDKNEITFEQLEGRRYYMKQMVEKIIATAIISNIEFN